MRKRIRYTFFQEIFLDLIQGFDSKRSTFKGLFIYAVDGLQLTLPRTADIVKAGYTGRAVSKYRDTYMPRMYLTHAYDVLSRVTKAFCYHPTLNEVADAEVMIPQFEQNSLSLYDRLFISKRLLLAHIKARNYFLFRCRRKGVPKAVEQFFSSHKTRSSFTWEGVRVILLKAKNPRNGKYEVFATNLDRSWLDEEMIGELYMLRWEVETSFRDLAATMKIEQWHSKSINGILQELFATFWLMNYVRIQIHFLSQKPENPTSREYQKPNYKLIFNWVLLLFPKILRRVRGVLDDLEILMKKSTARRKRCSRAYKREIKSPRSPYPYCNTGWTWDLK